MGYLIAAIVFLLLVQVGFAYLVARALHLRDKQTADVLRTLRADTDVAKSKAEGGQDYVGRVVVPDLQKLKRDVENIKAARAFGK